MATDKEALIGVLHTIFAYPDKAAEMMAAMEKASPDGLKFLEAWASGEYEKQRVEAVEAVPLELKELNTVTWDKVWEPVALEAEPIEVVPVEGVIYVDDGVAWKEAIR